VTANVDRDRQIVFGCHDRYYRRFLRLIPRRRFRRFQ
jgi:hypothetical protein